MKAMKGMINSAAEGLFGKMRKNRNDEDDIPESSAQDAATEAAAENATTEATEAATENATTEATAEDIESIIEETQKAEKRFKTNMRKLAEATSAKMKDIAADASEKSKEIAERAAARAKEIAESDTVQNLREIAAETAEQVKETASDVADKAKEYVESEGVQRALSETSAALQKTGKFAVKAGKTVSGVQAIQNRKEARALKSETEQLVDDVTAENEARREEVNKVVNEFAEIRLKALQDVVGRFLDYLTQMGRRNKSKEYDLLNAVGISVENIGELQSVEMNATQALKTLALGGSVGAIAVAGVPAAVTAAVGALATASTGTAISTLSGAAASNAVLAWLGGGSIAAGGGGIAAGSAILTGITAASTGIFALAAVSIVATAFYSKKLTEATENKAKMETWAAEVREGWVIIDGIKKRAEELQGLTINLQTRASGALDELGAIVNNFDEQNMEHVEKFQSAALLVKSMSELAQTPLIDESGNVSSESFKIMQETEKMLNNDLKTNPITTN